jgi:hypothetical protein|nr:MAG TPA: hypothetical protein [Caudoviricetes sp.]
MSDIEKRYDELEEAILTLNMQINETTDKYVKEILEDCKDRLQEEFDAIKDDTELIWENEKKELESEYIRSVL